MFIFGSAGYFVAEFGLSLIAVSQDYPLVAVFRLLTAAASHCSGEQGLQGSQSSVVAASEFSSCGSQAP